MWSSNREIIASTDTESTLIDSIYIYIIRIILFLNAIPGPSIPKYI